MAQKDKPQKVAGENSRTLLNALEGAKRPRVDTRDVQAIEQRISEYLQYCIEKDVAPSVQGCVNWLGINIKTLERWYAGAVGSPEHQRAAARIYGILQDVWAQKMDTGTINPVSGIFISKAMFGYRDQQEIVIHDGSQNQLSVADLIAESKRLPGAENAALTDSSKTIDADYMVVESDEGYEKAVARKKKMEERHEKAVARKEAYQKKYYQEHKAEQLERNRRSKARAAEKKKQSS